MKRKSFSRRPSSRKVCDRNCDEYHGWASSGADSTSGCLAFRSDTTLELTKNRFDTNWMVPRVPRLVSPSKISTPLMLSFAAVVNRQWNVAMCGKGNGTHVWWRL